MVTSRTLLDGAHSSTSKTGQYKVPEHMSRGEHRTDDKVRVGWPRQDSLCNDQESKYCGNQWRPTVAAGPVAKYVGRTNLCSLPI